MDLDLPSHGLNVSCGPTSTSMPLAKSRTKVTYLQHQSCSIKHMASTMEVDS
jgi:hypothetical protein